MSRINPNAGIGGTVINSAPAKAAKYHPLLSLLSTFIGVRTDWESQNCCQRFPAPFEFVAQDAGAASVEVAVDELDQHELDDANVFGEDKSVPRPLLLAATDPVVNVMTEPGKGILELYEELLQLESKPFPLLPNSHVKRTFILSCFNS